MTRPYDDKTKERSLEPAKRLFGGERSHAEKLCDKTNKDKPLSDTLFGDNDAGGRAGQGGMGGPAS